MTYCSQLTQSVSTLQLGMLRMFGLPLCMLWCNAMFSTQGRTLRLWGVRACLCSEPAWRLTSFLIWKCKAGKERITSPDIYICYTISGSYITSLAHFLLSFFAFNPQHFSPSVNILYLLLNLRLFFFPAFSVSCNSLLLTVTPHLL